MTMEPNVIWRKPGEIPQATGWYRVRRIDDGSVKVRAWGQGHWWTPLVDGWITMDGVYEWEHLPICQIDPHHDPAITPLEEMKRAEEIMQALDAKHAHSAEESHG